MSEIRKVRGGLTAPKGFVAGSVYCGIKKTNKGKPDMAMVLSEEPAVAAGVFTTNLVKAAPVLVSMEHARSGSCQMILANSGNANACTGEEGLRSARRLAASAGDLLGLKPEKVLVCSTGRIGVPLPVEKMEGVLCDLIAGLSRRGGGLAAKAIMTSDTFPKEIGVEFSVGGKPVRIGAIAKGAGMIDPNMATMLCFVTTDARVSAADLRGMLKGAVERSFNRITVDGDMSTNDTVLVLANGASGAPAIKKGTPEAACFQAALDMVTRELAFMIVEDGEGVSKFVEVVVGGAASVADARKGAEAIANSTLVKCAWGGNDPNWGRIVDALGYAGIKMDPNRVDVFYGDLCAVRDGMASGEPVAALKKAVRVPRFTVRVDLKQGTGRYEVYTTDLTTEYVVLNMSE